jgi:hypothetical protein
MNRNGWLSNAWVKSFGVAIAAFGGVFVLVTCFSLFPHVVLPLTVLSIIAVTVRFTIFADDSE